MTKVPKSAKFGVWDEVPGGKTTISEDPKIAL